MGIPLAVVQAIQIIGAVTAVAGTALSIKQGNASRRAQKAQNRKIKAVNAAKASSARRKAIRAERVRSAQLAAQAEAGGFTGSSTAILGEGRSTGITATTASQISNSLTTSNALSRGSQAIQDSNDRQQLFSNIAAIGATVFSAAGSAGGTGDGLFESSTPDVGS
jgi:hypothetical protein